MAFWFCKSGIYDSRSGRGLGPMREMFEASSPEDARVKLTAKEKTLQAEKNDYRLDFRHSGFFGPFKSREKAASIKPRYIRKKKRHYW